MITMRPGRVSGGPVAAPPAPVEREHRNLADSAATISTSRRRSARVGRYVLPPAVTFVAVVAAAYAMYAAGAHRVVAAVTLLLAVVVAALWGYSAAISAVLAAYFSLHYWFTPRFESLALSGWEDVGQTAVFGITAIVCGTTVARVNLMRQRAETHERAAVDAKVHAALNESRAGFLAAMTHSLRTPLASIKAAAGTLKDPSARIEPEGRTGLLSTIEEEADRLDRLVTKVLELGRIHAGALELRAEHVDLVQLAREAVRPLRLLADRRHVGLEVGGAGAATVDPAMIGVVLTSLLENAVRAAPNGSTVRVDVAPVDGMVEVRVVDHGPGVPEADRERVFDEFTRLVGADTAGAGIGLAIVRAFVDAHGGSARIETTPGGGATFVVSLPADDAP